MSRRDLLLFVLPFVLLALVTLRSGGGLRLEKDRALFAQELAREIPVGMPVAQAEQVLKSHGFFDIPPLRPIALGKPMPLLPKMLCFMTTQRAFPRLLDKHVWVVTITVRDKRVRDVKGGYSYSRFD